MENMIKGMDISSLIEEEECGAGYYDNGKQGDFLEIISSYGFNSARIRLWNDPYSEDGHPYGAGTNDLAKAKQLIRRAKSAGMSILLDFHYSDFWADPGKQILPKAWRGKDAGELERAVYDYTGAVLAELKDEGLLPEMVQVGNEVTNGLLWPFGRKPEYDNIAAFISAGIRAVREIDKNIKTMIHLDNGGNNEMYVDWFENYTVRGEDFDIMGLSYYPFWHGSFKELEFNLRDMAARYGKPLVIAEVSTGFSTEDYRYLEGLPYEKLKGAATAKPGLTDGLDYPMTKEGQGAFMKRVMELISSVPGGMGFYYWEGGLVPVKGCGWANEYSLAYTGEKGPGGNEWANQALFDFNGNALPALEVIRDY